MADQLKIINNTTPMRGGSIEMTQTAQDIHRSLHHALSTTQMTMIAGLPGAGKTKATFDFKQQNERQTVWHTAIAGEWKAWDVIHALMERLEMGKPNSRQMRSERIRVAEEIGPDRMLIIDEAQNLVQRDRRGTLMLETFEWLRGMAEEGGFALALVGDLSLFDWIQRLPQLRRRMIRPIIIRRIPSADVAYVAHHHGIECQQTIEALVSVAWRYGGLADVVNAIDHAKRLSSNSQVDQRHIMAAIEDLKLSAPRARKE